MTLDSGLLLGCHPLLNCCSVGNGYSSMAYLTRIDILTYMTH